MPSILVIDDSAEIRMAIRQMLTALDYHVSEAASGEQGVEAYQDDPAHVVLLDMFMPEHGGLATLSDLLSHDPKVRVIAMTRGRMFQDAGITEPAIIMGARRVLYKPIAANELHAAIEETMATCRG